MLFAGMIAYLAAEFTMTSTPHPAHIAVAAMFAGLGFVGGEVFHRMRSPF